MSRGAKQFIYGLFYLVIVGLIVTGIFYAFFRPAPSCFDGIQNEGEQGIDCGGPCPKPCTADLPPLSAGTPVMFTASPGSVTLIAQVADPNSGYGAATFDYTFNVYDATGGLLASFPYASFIYPDQSKYVTAVNVSLPTTTAAANANIMIASGTQWVASSTMGSVPQFTFQNLVTQEVSSDTVAASANLVNGQQIPFAQVFIVAIFKNANGTPVGVSQTEVDNVSAGGSVPVSVLYPAVPGIDASNTEMDAYAE